MESRRKVILFITQTPPFNAAPLCNTSSILDTMILCTSWSSDDTRLIFLLVLLSVYDFFVFCMYVSEHKMYVKTTHNNVKTFECKTDCKVSNSFELSATMWNRCRRNAVECQQFGFEWRLGTKPNQSDEISLRHTINYMMHRHPSPLPIME